MDSMTSLSDIYKCVVENCVKEYDLSDTARDIWLDPLKPVKMEGNTFVLATDIEFKRDTLNNLYVPYIEEQFKNVLGVPIKVKIIVDSSITADKPSISNLINAEPVNETVGEINNKITYTFDNFIVGPSNNLAFVAAKTVAKKQYDKFNPLFITTPYPVSSSH